MKKIAITCLLVFFAGTILFAEDFAEDFARDLRSTTVLEVQTRIDQYYTSSVAVEESFSARITPKITLLTRGLYHLRDGDDFSGAGLGGVFVLGGGMYSELSYFLKHFGETNYLHRLFSDLTYESAEWLGNVSAAAFIDDGSYSFTISPSYRYYGFSRSQFQARYILGIIPDADELLAHTGLAQYTFSGNILEYSIGGGGGSFGDEGTIKIGWNIFGNAGWEINEQSKITYGISFNSSDDGIRRITNSLIYSAKWQ